MAGVGDIKNAVCRNEQHVVQIRLHRHRTAHQPLCELDIKLSVLFGDSTSQLFQTTAGGQHDGIFDPLTQPLVTLTRFDKFDRFRSCRDTHGFIRLAISKDVVVLTGARTFRPQLLHFRKSVTFFQGSSHQRRHRSSVPFAFASAAHFAKRNPFGIHAAHAADERCVANIGKCNLTLRPNNERCGCILQADRRHIVQHSAVIQFAIFCG